MPRTLTLQEYLATLDNTEGYSASQGLVDKWKLMRRYLEKISPHFTVVYPTYTLHDVRHSDTVVEKISAIAAAAGLMEKEAGNALSRYEAFYLLGAAYLHDVGMVQREQGDEVRAAEEHKSVGQMIRDDHHERSARFIRASRDRFELTPQETDILALLCRGHRLINLEGEEFNDRFDDHGEPIRVRLLAALLRLGDELDMVQSRAPQPLRDLLEDNLVQFDRFARVHWMKHFYTESVSFSVEHQRNGRRIIYASVQLIVPDDVHFDYLKKQIRDQLGKHIENQEFRQWSFEFRLREIEKRLDPTLESSMLRKQDIHILYVDDDPNYRSMVAEALAKRGFVSCEPHEDAVSALASINEKGAHYYHLIILDLHMPDLRGHMRRTAGADLIPMFKGVAPNAYLVIFTSKESDSSEGIQKAHAADVKVIFKDQGPDKLGDEVAEVLRLSYIIPEEEGSVSNSPLVFSPYRVLVVDDHHHYAESIIEALTLEQHHITVDTIEGGKVKIPVTVEATYAAGADAAVRLLEEGHRFHAITLDKNMPNMNGQPSPNAGVELFRHIEQNYEDIGCLMLTSEPDYASYKQLRDREGMFDYCNKEEVTARDVAGMIMQMFEDRLVRVFTQGNYPTMADRMYFFGKKGQVVKDVSQIANEDGGAVKIEDQGWRATTKGVATSTKISAGTQVQAGSIRSGAVQVSTVTY